MLSAPHAPKSEFPSESPAQAKGNHGFLPIDSLKSGQVLRLAPHCPGGLIIQKPFFADFAGPGAAVGSSFDIECKAVYAIGKIQLLPARSFDERQHSYQKRIEYTQSLTEIASTLSPLHRAHLIVNQLCQWLGIEEARKVPIELIAQMVGVLPRTVILAWRQRPAQTTTVNPATMETLIVH
ncbi:MAG: hypothetical protein KME16_04590 [Scytolyngbya sp. HA4215-MV1]|jgi:hypothetical protein|nr:hypothetical protein [Scytolyngbya sp. HA4215-MV1]